MLQSASNATPHPPAAKARPYTWDDFLALDEDDLRELIDGDLIEVEVPTKRHEYIVTGLVLALGNWAHAHKAGHVLPSGYKVRITQHRGFMPDVQFYRRGNWPKGHDQGLAQGHPDLAVEIISPTSKSKDRVVKLQGYAAIGVPEYWIIDPEARTLERLVLRDGVYAIVETLEGNQVFHPDSFPSLEIQLSELWEVEEEDEAADL